jgi:hypothetical protein
MNERPALERLLDPTQCLETSEFIDSDSASVEALAHRVQGDGTPIQKAVRLFEHVRDEIQYEFRAKLTKDEYRASRVLLDGKGFCVQKAVLLCALLRAARIPSAIVLCDLKDYTLSTRVLEAMGTDTMFHHGLNAIHLNGRWLLADASLSPDVVERKRYRRVDFDGEDDALFPKTTLAGAAHAEVIRFHGMYIDLPFSQMVGAFMAAYAQADLAGLAEMGYRF